MPFSSNVNLTHRAAVAVISSLWNQDHIIADIQNILLGGPDRKHWTEIEKNVHYSLKKLELPAELKRYLENFLQPMGMQIRNWITLTESAFQAYPDISKPIVFVWTEKGNLDYDKVTKLINQSNMDKVFLCFNLACIFCIEEIILKHWPDVRHILTLSINRDPFPRATLLVYWTFYLNNEVEKLKMFVNYCGARNAFEFGFLFALEKECISSLNYFLQHIEPEKRRRLVLLAVQCILHVKGKCTYDGNLVFFLFSHLRESDVNKIKINHSYDILVSLLLWPSQEYFIPTAISLWEYMSETSYLKLFLYICKYVSKYYIGNLYKNLLVQFWQNTPSIFKECVKNKSTSFLKRIFELKNTDDIVQMIFNDCSPDEKMQMIFQFKGMNLCDLLVRKERWQSLKLFIKNCILSDAILEKFIEKYKNFNLIFKNKQMKLRGAILVEKIRECYFC